MRTSRSSPFANDPSQILKRREVQRRNILWLQDNIVLAVHHKRPKDEIDLLLKELRESVQVAKGN